MNRKGNKSISEKISDAFQPKQLLDPEVDLDDETVAYTGNYLTELADDIVINQRLSAIRKQNVKLLQDVDQKYRGAVSSRLAIDGDDNASDDDNDEEIEASESSEDDENDRQAFAKRLKNLVAESDEENGDSNASDDDEDVETVEAKSDGSDDEDDNNVEGFESSDADEDANDHKSFVKRMKNVADDSGGDSGEFEESDGGSGDEEDHEDDDDDDDESDFDGGDIMPNKLTDQTDADPSGKMPNHKSDIDKGVSVQNQLTIWEKLLEMRIHSQKFLIKANCLPPATWINAQREQNVDFANATKETASNVSRLMSKMLELQETLINKYPETNQILCKRSHDQNDDGNDDDDQDDDEGVDEPIEPATKRSKYEPRLKSTFQLYRPYRNEVIAKWYDRTNLLTPRKKSSKIIHHDMIRVIDDILANRSDLIRKTQLHKGNYELSEQMPIERLQQPSKIYEANSAAAADQDDETTGGMNGPTQIYCTEIYDDTDFYHTQLRELIEFKSNTSNNLAEMTKQFMELQQLRNKIKKVVDTRASKGRKIRYVVHNKLVNFMAQNDSATWTDDAKTELYTSLFGSKV